MYVPLSELING